MTDIDALTLDSNPADAVTIGNAVYFTATDGTHGTALWKSAGTAASTVMVADINPAGDSTPAAWMQDGQPNPVISQLTDFNGTLYFIGDDGAHGQQLWTSNGTAAGTTMVSEINLPHGNSPDQTLDSLAVVGNRLYFTALTGNQLGLWKSDGTAPGTVDIHDFTLPSQSLSDLPNDIEASFGDFTGAGGKLFFVADDGTHGDELWTSDGTAAGTHMVKDIDPGTDVWGDANSSSPTNLTALNGELYFSANDGADGRELWVSDGTANGTNMVKDIHPGSASGLGQDSPDAAFPVMLAASGKLFFNADDGVHGQELWISDGSAAGTHMVLNIHPDVLPTAAPPAHSGSSVLDLTAAGTEVFFAADDGVHGQELWKTDGTAAGTMMVMDLTPGSSAANPQTPYGSFPANLTPVSGRVYFTAVTSAGVQIFSTDGSADGTMLVTHLPPTTARTCCRRSTARTG